MDAMSFLSSHAAEVFAILFACSELIAYIPSVQANGLFQLVHFWLQTRLKKNA